MAFFVLLPETQHKTKPKQLAPCKGGVTLGKRHTDRTVCSSLRLEKWKKADEMKVLTNLSYSLQNTNAINK